jgi:hypothetical protein
MEKYRYFQQRVVAEMEKYRFFVRGTLSGGYTAGVFKITPFNSVIRIPPTLPTLQPTTEVMVAHLRRHAVSNWQFTHPPRVSGPESRAHIRNKLS